MLHTLTITVHHSNDWNSTDIIKEQKFAKTKEKHWKINLLE
jgi:hypothetical protein